MSPDLSTAVDAALYLGDRRISRPATIPEVLSELRETPGAFAWINLYRPTNEDLEALGAQFHLHPLAIEDAIEAHQRPKIEKYGTTLFLVLRPASVVNGAVTIGEQHVFMGTDFVITVRHTEQPDPAAVRERFGTKAPKVLYGVLDAVVDAYFPVLDVLEDRFDSLERTIYAGESVPSQRIYGLTRQVIDLDHAVAPLPEVLATVVEALTAGGAEEQPGNSELARHLRDVSDHVTQVRERCARLRNVLAEVVTVNSTLIAERQSEETKKISSWAAIFFFPTLVAGIYGMNFRYMPELHWALGYPMSFGIMLLGCLVLFLIFKRNDWL